MLLTAYSSDARVPLAGVLRYTEELRKAVHTHFSMQPNSGGCAHTLQPRLSGVPILKARESNCAGCTYGTSQSVSHLFHILYIQL